MTDNERPKHGRPAVSPVIERATGARFQFDGITADRLDANIKQWILMAPAANPAMLGMFRDRDRAPRRDLLPWSGEFAGKYLTSATQAYRLSPSPELRQWLDNFVRDLAHTQADDGYLGPFPHSERLIGPGHWDVWGHYHCMLGLLLWAEETGSETALRTCQQAADYLCRFFLDDGHRVIQAGSEEMNESIAHVMLLLYQKTGIERYLTLAREVEKDWETPPSGDYVRAALAGKTFYQCPKPRWESLHCLQAIAEFHFVTGEAKYRQAFKSLWWSIVRSDRHNTGGFSSGEKACGNPYNPEAIETCCTIAWSALCIDMLRLTGDSRAADELELSYWNAVLGAMSPSGRWWTYNTPMDGERKASAHDIVFQARAGSPELNCCSVNGPRGLGSLSDWALMVHPEGPVLNYYGPCVIHGATPTGRTLEIRQATRYPIDGAIHLTLSLPAPEQFTLRLRIPGWSTATRVRVGNQAWLHPAPGQYLALHRLWKPGDRIEVELDCSLRLWRGERECKGKASLYHGPLLLAYDPRFDHFDPTRLPPLDAGTLKIEHVAEKVDDSGPPPLALFRATDRQENAVRLCDFATAGATGSQYVSWLPLRKDPLEHPKTRG